MSRHVLRADDSYTVVVGYDDPLDTFFAQVYDEAAMKANPDGPEMFLLQTGENPGEVTDPEECLRSIGEYLLERPRGLLVELTQERRHRSQPTAFQRKIAKDVGGVILP